MEDDLNFILLFLSNLGANLWKTASNDGLKKNNGRQPKKNKNETAPKNEKRKTTSKKWKTT
jgi:hypothetical protein